MVPVMSDELVDALVAALIKFRAAAELREEVDYWLDNSFSDGSDVIGWPPRAGEVGGLRHEPDDLGQYEAADDIPLPAMARQGEIRWS